MLQTKHLDVSYDKRKAVDDFSMEISQGEIVSILGPNGSGKSTILNAIAKFIKHQKGDVYLNNRHMQELSTKQTARNLSVLSQVNKTPDDFTVEDIVYYGRFPHKKWYETKNRQDEEIVRWAIKETNLQGFEQKRVGMLSGGEQQRVWVALALSQQPKVLMLDEPTTYLDVCHQLEVLELVKRLNRKLGLTVVMVLHDLMQAARYSDRVLVIKDGALVADGSPKKVLTEQLIRDIYNVESYIIEDERMGGFTILPTKICKKIGGEEGETERSCEFF